jgi:hypothetical protein
MVPNSAFNHKKFSSYFCIVLRFQFFKTENLQKPSSYFCLLWFVNLRAVGASQPPQLVGDAKLFVHCSRLFKERGRGTNLKLPREFDNYPESPFWGKLLFLHHSALRVPTSGILKD